MSCNQWPAILPLKFSQVFSFMPSSDQLLPILFTFVTSRSVKIKAFKDSCPMFFVKKEPISNLTYCVFHFGTCRTILIYQGISGRSISTKNKVPRLSKNSKICLMFRKNWRLLYRRKGERK